MKTHILTTKISNSHAQTTLKFGKDKCGVIMALILLSTTQLAVSADFTSAPVPQHQQIPSGSKILVAPTNPVISTEAYQFCLSRALDIIESGACTAASGGGMMFCIRAQFIADGNDCAYFL